MSVPAHVVRFGPFQLDVRAAELRLNGNKTKLPEQPFQVLTALLEKPGEVVTREELRQRLWGGDTFVDFEHGLNTAVKHLRKALGDSAENPRFIETLPRHGYRLIVPVDPLAPLPAVAALPAHRGRVWLAMSVVIALAVTVSFIWRQRSLQRLPPIRIESLAVLPLENLSGNPEEEYFADGMTEALITELGKVHSLRVISRQSVMQYRGTSKTVPQIAKELNVDAVVEGSALRSSGKVRITTQLIQANPERHLWSESYERSVSDVIVLQREVAQAIAREIRVTLTPQEAAILGRARPSNPEAYNAYLLGRFYSEHRSRENLERAISEYRRAIELDGGYAPAWAMLSDALDTRAGEFGPPDLGPMREAADRALALDPNSAEAHIAVAQIKLMHDADWAGADAHLRRALALAPGNAWAVRRAAQLARTLGNLDEALRLGRRSIELNPLSPVTHFSFAITAVFAGRLEEALAAVNRAAQIYPDYPELHWLRGHIYDLQLRPQEALSEAEREPNPMYRLHVMALAQYSLGRKDKSDTALAELIRKFPGVGAYCIATVYAVRGELDPATHWLERAYAQHDPDIRFIKKDPRLKNIERHPRYTTLLRLMNLP